MIPWILLKLIPAVAFILQIQHRIQIYGLLACTVIATGFVLYEKRRSHSFKMFGTPLLVGLFFASLLPNIPETIVTGSTAEIFPTIRGQFLLVALLFLVRSQKQARIWLVVLFAVMTGIQVGHLAYGNSTVQEGVLENVYDIDRQRLTGIADSPWTVSYASIVFVGAGLVTAEVFEAKWIRMLVYALASLGVANLFLTITRGVLVGLPVLLTFWFAEKLFRRKDGLFHLSLRTALNSMLVFVSGLSLCVIIGIFLFPDVVDYYFSMWLRRFEPGVAGESSRWASNLAGINMFVQHPILGVGWECCYVLSWSYGAGWGTTAHNAFIQAAAQGGVVGLAFSVMLFVVVPWRLFWTNRYVPGSLVFLGAWGAVFTYNMLASNFMCDSHWDILCIWILALASRGELPQVRDAMPKTVAVRTKFMVPIKIGG